MMMMMMITMEVEMWILWKWNSERPKGEEEKLRLYTWGFGCCWNNNERILTFKKIVYKYFMRVAFHIWIGGSEVVDFRTQPGSTQPWLQKLEYVLKCPACADLCRQIIAVWFEVEKQLLLESGEHTGLIFSTRIQSKNDLDLRYWRRQEEAEASSLELLYELKKKDIWYDACVSTYSS